MFVSLGSNCYVSWTLRRIGLQTKSLPLDWANSFDFSKIKAFLTEDPSRFLSDLAPSRHPLDIDLPLSLYSDAYELRLPHEFDLQPDITLEGIRERYRRRVSRFWSEVAAADQVVFVRALSDGQSSDREFFSEAVPTAQKFLDTLSHLRCKPAMILLSNDIEEPVDVGGYDIALIDRAIPFDCCFYQYGAFDISIEAASSFYESFFWTPHRDVADMVRCYRALAKAPGVRNHPTDKPRLESNPTRQHLPMLDFPEEPPARSPFRSRAGFDQPHHGRESRS